MIDLANILGMEQRFVDAIVFGGVMLIGIGVMLLVERNQGVK